jgi:hypothetical protein
MKPTFLKNVVMFLKNLGRSLKNGEKCSPTFLKKCCSILQNVDKK